MARWASMLPAAARVVPRPEKKILADGGKSEGHVALSEEVRGWSLVEAEGLGRSRRA